VTPPGWADPELWASLRFAQKQVRKYSRAEAVARRRGDRQAENHAQGMCWEYEKAFSRGIRALHGGRLPWLLGGS
jgi:hypothetical protein